MAYNARVLITPKAGVLDPQGQAVQRKLQAMSYEGIRHVQIGRLIQITVEADSPTAAQAQVDDVCRRLLVNPVTENYEFELFETPEV